MDRIATIHPEGLFEWDQNEKTRKKPMRIGEYVFAAIHELGRVTDSRKFLASTYGSEAELMDAVFAWVEKHHPKKIVVPEGLAVQ